MTRESFPVRSARSRRALPALVAGAALAVGAVAAETAAAACSAAVPDSPQCACAVNGPGWPSVVDQDQLLTAARRTVGAQASCLRHGGQPYFQIQMLVLSPLDANTLADLDPNIGTDFRRQAWCTETVAYWHYVALMPFLGGYANPDWHQSPYVTSVQQMRTWYRTEEELRNQGKGGRGRWISGAELDYANFVPGVNGPCPGAYQAMEAYDSTGGSWSDSCHHSQVVDSMVVWRVGSVNGPVTAVDIRMIDGNAGGGTFVDVNGTRVSRGVVRDTAWYRNVIDYTLLGRKTTGCGGRKIRGWGIDLHADGTTYCDPGRIMTIVTPFSIAYPAPIRPDEPDSFTVNTIIDYVLTRPGPILVTGNSSQVQTGGALPGRGNHWFFTPGSSGVDPLYAQVDLRAEHPLRVRGVVVAWKGGVVPSQYQVLWGGATGAPMSRTFTPATGGGPSPTTQEVPIPTLFGPAPNYAVRYLRVSIPASAMTRPFEIAGLHLLFDYGKEDDNGGVDTTPATLGVGDSGPSGAALRLSPGAPNPFAARTVVAFELPAAADVTIAIYDVAGRKVRTLPAVSGRAGRNEFAWDGLDAAGRRVENGAYFAEVRAGAERGIRRVVLLR